MTKQEELKQRLQKSLTKAPGLDILLYLTPEKVAELEQELGLPEAEIKHIVAEFFVNEVAAKVYRVPILSQWGQSNTGGV